jgi:hypothetical protein
MATPTKPDLFTPRPGHYPTKRDRRFQLLIWGTALLLIGPTVSLMWRQPGLGWWLGTLLMAVTMMTLWTVQSMHYRLETGKLRIVAGPMSREIPLSTIQTVTMVRSGGAAPAMSLDRLEIVWTDEGRTDTILISPLDREAFLSEMGQYDRGLKKVEGGLRRR